MSILRVFFFLQYFLLVQSLSKILYKSDFLLDANGWEIIGNNPKQTNSNEIKYYPYTLIQSNKIILNRYIVGEDMLIDVSPINKQYDDKNVWYFKHILPPYINIGNAKLLTFTLYSFVGDFSKQNNNKNPLVRLISRDNLVAESKPNLIPFSKTNDFNVPLIEEVFCIKEKAKTNCNFKKVLSNLKEIHILGDWTQGYEVIGLDNLLVYCSDSNSY